MIVHVMRIFRADDRDGTGVRGETAFDVQRLPRTCSFVFGHQKTVFGGGAKRGHIAGSRDRTADVDERKTNCPSYRGIALPAGPKGIVAGVDAQFLYDRAVDDDQRCARMGGRLYAV